MLNLGANMARVGVGVGMVTWDIDSSPPGSPVPGILQARILEWVAISFSRGSS